MNMQNDVWVYPAIFLAVIALSGCGWVSSSSHHEVLPAPGSEFLGGDMPSMGAPPSTGSDENYDSDYVPNFRPVFDNVEVVDGTVFVTVSDPEGDEINIEVTEIPGMSVYPYAKVTGSGTATFQFVANQEYTGEVGETTITIRDGMLRDASKTVTVSAFVPEDFVFWSEYERWFRVLTLNMDFSSSEHVKLEFTEPGWMTVRGGNEQIVSGGWSSRTFEVILDNCEENSGILGITAFSVDENGRRLSGGSYYKSFVEISRPVYIGGIAYDYIEHEVSVEVDSDIAAVLSFDVVLPNGIQGSAFQQDPDNLNLFTLNVDYSNALKLYGDAEVTVTDQYANADTESTLIQHESVGIIDDRIYAIFDKEQVGVGEEVLVTVTTGKLSHPFQFLLNVGLVVDEDAKYVSRSFNIGSPGGNRDFSDGIWAMMNPLGYILPPDVLFQPGANPEDSLEEKTRLDFNISPFRGSDVTGASGDLFNIRLKYSEPGLKTLTFQQSNGVNRTYYSCVEERWDEDRFWDDCSNWHPGLQTSIVVE